MERQDWYLATLGVVRYVPRGSVAAQEMAQRVTQEVARELAETAAPDTRAATEGRAALHRLLTDEASASGQNPAAPSHASSVTAAGDGSQAYAEPVAKKSDERSDEKIEVRLAVWQPAPDLLFFDSLQPTDQPSIQMARLVTHIAAALGHQTDSTAMPQLIDWPPARSRVAGGLEAARTMVSAFCDARLSGESVQLVLIMGSDAVRLLLPDEDVSEVESALTLRWRARDTVVVPALSDMLNNPSTKRRVWHALAPFGRH